MLEGFDWAAVVDLFAATPSVVLATAAFFVFMTLHLATMAAVVGVPGWFCVKAFGWRTGLMIYGLLLLTAYRMTV